MPARAFVATVAMAADSAAGCVPVAEALASHVGAPVRLDVSYESFEAPAYDRAVSSVTGRLWTYDAEAGMAVVETGDAAALPPALSRAAAAAVYGTPASARTGAAAKTTGFKLVSVRSITAVHVLSEDAYDPLSEVGSIADDVLDARNAAAAKKGTERAHQIGPREAGAVGQAVFDALSKTYVPELTQTPLPLARIGYHCARRSRGGMYAY